MCLCTKSLMWVLSHGRQDSQNPGTFLWAFVNVDPVVKLLNYKRECVDLTERSSDDRNYLT